MNEELLYNQLYDKTKDCGRTQFVKLLMEKERENKNLKDEIYKSNAVSDTNRELAEKYYKEKQELIDYLKEEINKINEQIEHFDLWREVGVDINFLILKKQMFKEILSKIEKE